MRITRQTLSLRHVMSHDASRTNINGIRVEESGRVVATNGHILAHYQPAMEEGEHFDAPFTIDAATIDTLRKTIPKGTGFDACAVVDVGETNKNGYVALHIGGVGGMALSPAKDTGEFPNWRQVVPDPKRKPAALEIGLSPRALGNLLATVNEFSPGKYQPVIRFRFWDQDHALEATITNDDGQELTIVAMPCHL